MDHEPPPGTTPSAERGDWILTASGQHFHLLDPRPEEVELHDIITSLSHQCRWTGHLPFHYSIAQHACHVAEVVEAVMPGLALAALHHDSMEAYTGDMNRPWKRSLRVFRGGGRIETVETAEARIQAVIHAALGIPEVTPMEAACIQTIDNRMLRTEFKQLMPHDTGAGWDHLGDPLPGVWIAELPSGVVYRRFLALHARLHAAHGIPR